MFKKFYPDVIFEKISDVSAEFLKERGITHLILDIDNTLVSYTSPYADENAKKFLSMLAENGIDYAFVSNNHKDRVEKFAAEFDAFYVYDSGKPFLFGINRAMRHMCADKKNTALIGDQIFTDVYAGRRAKILTIMVNPIEAKETPFFAIKRYFEKIVLKGYQK